MIPIVDNIGFIKLNPITISESIESNNGLLIIPNVLLSTADMENGNGRIYPKPLLEDAIRTYNDKVTFGNAYGELDHDESPEVRMKFASHRIKSLKWVGNSVYGDIEVLSTDEFPCGRIVAGLVKRGMPIGISSRSLGTVRSEGGKTIVDSLIISCYDFVSNPSNYNSFAMLSESLDYDCMNAMKYGNINEVLNKILTL